MKYFSLFTLFLLIAFPASAQFPISDDRAGLNYNTSVVPIKTYQVETGFIVPGEGDVIGSINFRTGLAKQLEIQFSPALVDYNTDIDAGSVRTQVALKYTLEPLLDDKLFVGVIGGPAFELFDTFPENQFFLRVLGDYIFNDQWSINTNIGSFSTDGSASEFVSVSPRYAINDQSLITAGFIRSGNTGYLEAGYQYTLNPNFAIDVSLLSDSDGPTGVNAGASFRLQ